MPLVHQEGKDTIIFASKEDHSSPCTIELPEPEPSPGLILPNGEINWNCPCLGGMATGPCGLEFREAFSCFHYSTADPKGMDCRDQFTTMQLCMSNYPELYGSKDSDEDAEMTSTSEMKSIKDTAMESKNETNTETTEGS